jgi:glutamine synthetase adenylyltransferase
MANMKVEQSTQVSEHGVIIMTRITAGALFQAEYVVPFLALANAHDAKDLISHIKAAEARKLFSAAWEKLNG